MPRIRIIVFWDSIDVNWQTCRPNDPEGRSRHLGSDEFVPLEGQQRRFLAWAEIATAVHTKLILSLRSMSGQELV